MLTFTNHELQVILQALSVAQMYYEDPNRRVAGMHPPNRGTVTDRLTGIVRVCGRIVNYVEKETR